MNPGPGEGYQNWSKDTLVACLLDDNYEDGWILGQLYPDSKTFSRAGENLFIRTFPDGTVIEYDAENHALKADVKGSAEVKAQSGVKLDADVEITGALTVRKGIDATDTIKTQASVEAQASVKGASVEDAQGTLAALRGDYKYHPHPDTFDYPPPPAPIIPKPPMPPITTQ
jgi:phage baseplate assembly protein gpV